VQQARLLGQGAQPHLDPGQRQRHVRADDQEVRAVLAGAGAVDADSTTTSDDELLTVAMLCSSTGGRGQYIEI
jgi:hypothetical protein